MDRARRTDIGILIVLALIAALLLFRAFFSAPGKSGASSGTAAESVTYEDYNGRNIGILTGTNMEQESFKYFPDSQYFYFDGYPNMNAALQSGVIDAYLGDEPALKSIHAQKPQIDYIKERLTNNRYSFAFRKNDPAEKKLLDQFNNFLKKIKEDGTYDEIDALWFGTDEKGKVVDMSGLTGENGTIHVVTTPTDEPFCYIKDGQHVGYDIDVAVRFCREYGYAIEFGDVDFQARIPALQSGRYEFTTTMNVTPEREESVLFSDPVSEGGIVVAVRAEDLPENADAPQEEQGFIQRLAASFERNFIRENRWKMILSGIGTTCLITFFSILFGTILAFLICLLRHTGSRLGSALSDLYVKILQGTPTVVLLMILFYLVFRGS
ncbi:MAG: transporter substrate-binding domain-containing protein, partial [Lachnospiraceae bacterium]|nr:transporter substrate-binding domain-containing protein [Lachnospiraceae bacterium]